jgi:hypothetical protein
MGDRVVDCARLESVCTPKGYRGFESLPIRQSLAVTASFQDLQFLSQLHHAAFRQDAAEIHTGIDETIAAEN